MSQSSAAKTQGSADARQGASAPAQSGPPPVDERDATIERLERMLAEERKNAQELRQSTEGLRFQMQVLEKSYAKQLADARAGKEAAERALAEQRAKLEAFGSTPEETMQLLADTRAELERVTAHRDQLHKELTQADRPRASSGSQRAYEAQPQDGSLTINELIADAHWMRDDREPGDTHLHSKVKSEEDTPAVEMISPDLVFTKGRKDSEDDD
jgi:hypothetical protein